MRVRRHLREQQLCTHPPRAKVFAGKRTVLVPAVVTKRVGHHRKETVTGHVVGGMASIGQAKAVNVVEENNNLVQLGASSRVSHVAVNNT